MVLHCLFEFSLARKLIVLLIEMYRLASTVRSSYYLMPSKAIVSSLKGPSVLSRSYWWKKKSDDEKNKKELKKEEPKKEEEKSLVAEKNADNEKDKVTVTKIDFTKPAGKMTLGDVFKMIATENEGGDENGPEDLGVGNSFSNMDVSSFLTPRPSISDKMILPAIPLPVRPLLPGFIQNLLISDRRTIQKLKEINSSAERFVGLFLRKEISSNELSDSPDVIHSLDEICKVGTYIPLSFIIIDVLKLEISVCRVPMQVSSFSVVDVSFWMSV